VLCKGLIWPLGPMRVFRQPIWKECYCGSSGM